MNRLAGYTSFFAVLCALLLFSGRSLAVEEAGDAEKVVYVYVVILDVDAISSADQSFTINYYAQFRWTDPSLAHPGPGSIRRSLNDIVAPRFILLNQQKTWSSLLNLVDISPEGEVIYRQRLWGDFSQPLRLHDFPFDSHTFELPMLAAGDLGEQIKLLPDPDYPSFISSELSVADWSITGYSEESRDIVLTDEAVGGGYVFSFQAKRIFNHYVIKFIIPLILIVAMSWVVFWIDPSEAGSQLSVAVTAALTLIAYHIALAGKLPDIPYLTRMDMFLFCSTLMVFTALVEVVVTSRLASDGKLHLARRFDQVSRVLFPSVYLGTAGWAFFSAAA
ncbi:MAG: hypothetical protein ABJN62_06190 [Halioglobus sp.]